MCLRGKTGRVWEGLILRRVYSCSGRVWRRYFYFKSAGGLRIVALVKLRMRAYVRQAAWVRAGACSGGLLGYY